MAGQKFKSARTIAVEVLNKYDPVKNYAGPLLDRLQHETDQSQRATDLVFGTLRNRTAIDAVIAAFSGRPVERIQAGLLNIIRVGTYELIYCPSAEPYAIVNEAVASCRGGSRTARTDKQAGFVNAVLRQITRHISNRRVPLSQADAQRTLPQSPATGSQFDTAFLPDCQAVPAEYLSTVFSLPEWLLAGWLAEFGEESTRRICLASNRRPSIYIRPNPLKTEGLTAENAEKMIKNKNSAGSAISAVNVIAKKMADAEIGFEIAGDSEMIRIKSPRDVTQLPGFAEGQFTVQDITASKPVRLLVHVLRSAFGVPRHAAQRTQHEKFLDLCAAPGTKTTQLAEATGDAAKIIATDIDARRLEMVRENITRLGIKSVDVVPYDEFLDCKGGSRTAPTADSKFDCVLLDVPCSNTGVLARRIEARYRINPKTIGNLARLQVELLGTAAGLVKPGGKICYSTCSIQKEENRELVEKFLKKNKNFTLESEQLTLPEAEGFDHDGGYAAILVERKA